MIKKALLIFTLVAFTFILSNHRALAIDPLDTAERIKEFNASYKVNKDGTVDVQERILYFFSIRRHGIFRNIPFMWENDEGKKYAMKIENITVDGGPFTKAIEGDEIKIKIGDADKYVLGEKLYKIDYKLSGALTYFSDHDEFYWNVTGNGWDVPIDEVYATVTFPFELTAETFNSACYTGSYGSSLSECGVGYSGNRAEYVTNRHLYSNEGLSIVAGFPKGMVDVLESKPYTDWWKIAVTIFWYSLFFAIYVLWPITVVRKWYKDYKQTRKAKIVAAWFEPPHDIDGKGHLSPAETSVLIDKNVDHKDITATLIDLAQRKYLKIREKPDKKNQFDIIMRKDAAAIDKDTTLKDFEKLFLTALVAKAGVDSTVSTESLSKSLDFGKKIDKFYDAVSKGLVTKKIFKDNPHDTHSLYFGLAIMGLCIGDLPMFIASLIFGRKSALKTDLGVEKYGEAVSLKKFLVSQDEQLNFQAKNQMFFEKLLPYATAFGVEEVWAKRFAGIVMQNPDWYEGQNFSVGTYAVFNHAVQSSFSSSYASSSYSSSTGHHSGFSGGGGGFSGGGGGGGGGGSW